MLRMAILFLIIALIAGVLGFSGFIVGTAVTIAKGLLLVFLVLFVLSLFSHSRRSRTLF